MPIIYLYIFLQYVIPIQGTFKDLKKKLYTHTTGNALI